MPLRDTHIYYISQYNHDSPNMSFSQWLQEEYGTSIYQFSALHTQHPSSLHTGSLFTSDIDTIEHELAAFDSSYATS